MTTGFFRPSAPAPADICSRKHRLSDYSNSLLHPARVVHTLTLRNFVCDVKRCVAQGAWVLNRLDVLSRKAEDLGQISAAARCEELIGKHRGMFVDCTALFSDLDPDKMSPELLDKIANRMIEQALGSGAAAEVDRRLKAGESVELADVQKAIEAPGEPLTIDAVCQAVTGEPTGTALEPDESQKRC